MTAGRGRRRLQCLLAPLLLVSGLVACGGSSTPVSSPAATPSTSGRPPVTVEYAPGLTEALFLPDQKGRHPLVVMVPGGSWTTADPSGLAGLAADLAAAGVAAAPTHIRAAEDGVVYPVPVEDVLCAVAAAAAQARSHGIVPGPVAVLGHSSGAQLAALAVLAVADYSPTCSSPPVTPTALVGLSGPYDISQLPDVAQALLGTTPDDDPARWQAANPVRRAGQRPDVPVLLLHGERDDVVPVDFTSQFGQALKDAGHPTTIELVPDADHQSIYTAEVSGARIAQWLLSLTASAG